MKKKVKIKNHLGRLDFQHAILRSFVIQAAGGYKMLGTVGYLFCLLPGLRHLYPDVKRRRAALKRVNMVFNTNPFFSTFMIGYTLRREQSEARKKGTMTTDLGPFMQGPLSAIGDSLFWGTVRPGAGLLGVMIALFGPQESWMVWIGPALFLLAFNIPHIYFRFHGMSAGFIYGEQINRAIQGTLYANLIQRIHLSGSLVVGALASFLLFASGWNPGSLFPINLWAADQPRLIFLACILFYFLLRFGLGPTRLLYIGFVLATSLTWISLGA